MWCGRVPGGTRQCLDRIQRSLNTNQDFIIIIGFVPSHSTVPFLSLKHPADDKRNRRAPEHRAV